jgi:CRISPR-associated endoribonuclease Cas6
MRIKVTLEPTRQEFTLPVNYMYPLSAVVYKIFSSGSEEVAKWLHEEGFKDSSGKNLKLFNFSQLKFEKYQIQQDSIRCYGNCSFVMSSPVETELIETFVQGIFRCQEISIGNRKYSSYFRIKEVEIQKPMEFSNECIFRTMTPITVSTIGIHNEKPSIHYIFPNEEAFTEGIVKNLLKKYKMVKGSDYTGELNVAVLNPDNTRSKLITIKESTAEETKVKGFLIDINVNAEPLMMQVLYNCGVGEKNSGGWGMLTLLSKGD